LSAANLHYLANPDTRLSAVKEEDAVSAAMSPRTLRCSERGEEVLSEIAEVKCEDESGERGELGDESSRNEWDLCELNPDEKVLASSTWSVECAYVCVLDVVEGLASISDAGINFIPSKRVNLQPDIPAYQGLNKFREKNYRTRLIRTADIVSVRQRRFNLQRTAAEVFTSQGTSYFFNFTAIEKRREFFEKLRSLKPPLLQVASMLRPESLIWKSKITERWQHGEMSNFDYLMHLNTISGRTYNDLNQYPVFPWIIADYSSNRLDLESPETFRDLAKPIGALHEERLQKTLERYNSLVGMDTPPFHYGTHYSNAAAVLYYLIRLEPYASLHVELQAGKFDVADRLFSSIPHAWENSLSCYRELIPEFFYLPEFLNNVNGYNLGIRQDGTEVSDCKLPPWARNADEFVRLNRMALESEHVSQNLHHWIDLIFGYKQRGKAAQEAHNVFYHLTYEGAVNLDTIVDEAQRSAVLQQIALFGQTPLQLFSDPHPRRDLARRSLVRSPDMKHHMFSKEQVISSSVPGLPKEGDCPSVSVHSVHCVSDGVISMHGCPCSFFLVHLKFDGSRGCLSPFAVSREQGLFGGGIEEGCTFERREHIRGSSLCLSSFPFLWCWMRDLCTGKGVSLVTVGGLPDGSLKLLSIDYQSLRFGGTELKKKSDRQSMFWQEVFECVVAQSSKEAVLTLRQTIVWHRDAITCIAVDRQNALIATGSKDCTVAVGNLFCSSRYVEASARVVLHGHEDAVSRIALDSELDECISCSTSGAVLVHRLSTGVLCNVIRFDFPKIDFLGMGSEGYVVSFCQVI
jgi:hypothetical protein